MTLLALPLALSGSGCSSTISAHQLDLTVDYDGVHTQAVLAFADFDPNKFDTAGDSTCRPFTPYPELNGDCEVDRPMQATIVSGDAPVQSATMTAGLNGAVISYDVFVNRAADDPRPPDDPTAEPFRTCNFLVGDGRSDFGQPRDCSTDDAHPCTMTLRPH
jgi:hypothetical protein